MLWTFIAFRADASCQISYISMIDYGDHMPCMNCREEEINQEEARMKPAYA
jgi:hypothetical protein